MKKGSMYKELSKYYDLLYGWKDYKQEVAIILKLIKKHKRSKGKQLLDVACGTGEHLKHLQKKFNCTGLDYNKEMLALAKKKNPKVPFAQGDMVTFSRKQQFDVITCLFSSIGYVKTLRNLERALKNFHSHLTEGGILIIEPWLTKKTFKPGKPSLTTYQDDDLVLVRTTHSTKKANTSVFDFHFIINERKKGITHFRDVHTLGLFETKMMLQLLDKLGFTPRYYKEGLHDYDRGIIVAIKRPVKKQTKQTTSSKRKPSRRKKK